MEKTNYVIIVGDLNPQQKFYNHTRQQNYIISDAGVSMAVTAKHSMHPFKIMERTKVISPLKGKTGKSWYSEQQTVAPEGIARTVKNTNGSGNAAKIMEASRIRLLTPRELFRLMGVRDAQIDTLQAAGLSRTRQTQLAGNSIVVDVLYYIFDRMFVHTEPVELTLF